MSRRRRLSRRGSRRLFTKTAQKIHKKNVMSVMRGGVRL